MKSSESINELATALSKAQAEMKHASKDAVNPAFKSKYATLAAVFDAVRGPLTKNGIAFPQFVIDIEGGVAIETVLMHSSGQWISSTCPIPVMKATAHQVGGAITYAKRFGLAAICGIAAEDDDDGNAAVEAAPKRRTSARAAVLETSGNAVNVDAYFEPLTEAIEANDVAGFMQLKEELDALGENAYVSLYDQMTPLKRGKADYLLRKGG